MTPAAVTAPVAAAPVAPGGVRDASVTAPAGDLQARGGESLLRSAAAGRVAGADGPGVVRDVIPKARLERDPKLRGKLDPPTGGRPPRGVSLRTRADGTRVVTINVHGGAPAGRSPSTGQQIEALRDVARYVNGIDADVVMVQELNDVRGSGIPHTPSVLAHLLGASDMAYTPGNGAQGTHRGTAIYTRNGFTIGRAVNVDLPDVGDPARRSAGVAVVQPPDQRPAFTAISTHMSHMPTQAASDRRHDQLAEVDRIAQAIARSGAFSYRDPGGGRHEVQGFPGDRIIFGGDLNTTQQGRHANDSADRELRGSGLRHANDLDPRGDRRNGHIDHLYARGFAVSGSAWWQVPAHELQGGRPTDHPGYVADFR